MARHNSKKHIKYCGVDAVDLFCGGGGLTCGLRQAGIDVRFGIDSDGRCKYAYEHNNNAKFLESSVRVVKGTQLSPYYRSGRVKLLAGCAPCQTFSRYNQKVSHRDARWSLLSQFKRLISEVHPELVTMENVPAIIGTGVFDKFISRLKELKYHYDFKIIKCNEYGISQLRQRVVLIASLFADIKVPAPPKDLRLKTVREIIGDLPALKAGECDPDDRLHFCAALSPLNMRRIQASRQGGSWRDWPEELVAKCHRKDTGKTYGGVYGRMSWDKSAPTMTTQFYGFGNGRFGHPEQDRAISIREGAMFQGFPRDYQFVPEGEHAKISLLGKMIGNAVPVQLGRLVGETFISHLKQLDLLRDGVDA